MKYKHTPKHPKKTTRKGRHASTLPLLEIMAKLLTSYSIIKLPNGCLDGRLKGAEEDIRQDGIIIALDWLNKHLRKGGVISSWNYRRSLAIALRFSRRRHIQQIERSLDHLRTEQPREDSCDHPTQEDLTNWPIERMRKIASCAISIARKDRIISKANASVANLVLVKGLTAEEAANQLGVTRSAVYQQLGRIERLIKPTIDQTEASYEI